MPERNLVTSNSFKVFMVALSMVAMQVGCSKLRNSSALLNQDYLIEEPNFNKDPAAAEVAKTTTQAETPGRFVNDPQKALDELFELGGEFVENVADDEDPADIVDDAEAEIFAVAQSSNSTGLFEENSNPVPPPAPSIKDMLAANSAASNQVAESNPIADLMVGNAQKTNGKPLDVMAAAAVRDPIRLTGTSPSQLRPINPASHATSESSGIIKLSTMQPLRPNPQQDITDADCSHIDCDCMKPKLKPELPFAEPVSFPQTKQTTQPSPSSPLSRPLSPIMFDRTTRQVEANDQTNMKNNSLRMEVNSNLRSGKIVQTVRSQVDRDPDQPAAKNQLKNSFQPIVSAIESPVVDEELGQAETAMEPVKTEIAQSKTTELPKTHYSGFEISPACQSCLSTQCNGQCGESQEPSEQFNVDTETEQPMVAQTEFTQTESPDPTQPENVVIVATLNKDTIPPFAEHPNLDEPPLTAEKIALELKRLTNPDTLAAPGSSIQQLGNPLIATAMSKPDTPLADPNSFSTQSTDLAPTDAMDEAFLASQPKLPLVDTDSFMPEPINHESTKSMEAQDLSEQEWNDIFGPVVTGTHNASADAGCSECGSGECEQNCLGEPLKQQVNADFAPPTPIELPAQTEPAKISNEFVPSATSPAGHQAEVATSTSEAWDATDGGAISVSWVAPATANFSPIQPTPEPTTKPDPVAAPEPAAPLATKSAATNADADTIAVPNSDANENATADNMDDMANDLADSSSASDQPEVVVEVIDNTVPWDVKLDQTIETVRGQVAQEGDLLTRNGMEVNLRLLEILQRQLLTAEENVSVMSNDEREYWQHQLDAITMMLPEENTSDSDMDRHNAAYLTLGHLRKAVERLESIAKLDVANGTFCTEISGFGKFKPFSNTTFKPGQRTLVYCEVENFMSNRQVENFQTSFHTQLRGSYVVYDQEGRAVQQAEYPMVEDVARQRRRDFYLYFPIQIGKLAPGNYRLELLIEDLSNNKTASLNPGMTFQVEK